MFPALRSEPTGELKTARGRLMHPQKHLYNGLARPEDYSIFARKWTRAGDSTLAAHRNEIAACSCGGADVGRVQTSGRTTGQSEYMMPPLQATLLAVSTVQSEVIISNWETLRDIFKPPVATTRAA